MTLGMVHTLLREVALCSTLITLVSKSCPLRFPTASYPPPLTFYESKYFLNHYRNSRLSLYRHFINLSISIGFGILCFVKANYRILKFETYSYSFLAFQFTRLKVTTIILNSPPINYFSLDIVNQTIGSTQHLSLITQPSLN